MGIDSKEIEYFKELWLTEYSESIDDARALKEAGRLLALMKFTTEPMPNALDPPDKIKE